ncbi:FMN-binding protein [Streptomyces sp. NBC_00083]|uniref:FMN-binding protein n=1 Tax=Streptomyces sp. NBC_00083 TaxID=2975647 RepID=UPI00224CED07|nr:FMN-binding protein [Streptomyces sp. NBC_00083]MCX5387308.1 FMN-binding protein [Streptomyces sp. NBC_00083]
MRRVAVTTLSTAAGIVMLLALKPHQSHPPVVSAPRPAASASGTQAAGARTGDFTGDVIDTRYGPVQVSVTLAKGRLTAVHVLQVPSERGRDQEIAARAVPRLTEEALGAQNAQIDAVSGASYTSEGYIESLQSALDKAGA